MGLILSKILGSKVTLRERLDKVDKELRNIQRFQFDTELSQKRWIGRLMIASSVLYLIAAGSFYFFGPLGATWKGTIPYLLPFLIFPFLIWGLKRLMAWYYKRKIGNNVDSYKELKMERQRLLEDVMEFETFNNAKEILEKYDPNRLLPKYLADHTSPATSPTSATPVSSRFGPEFQESLRKRNLAFNQAIRPLAAANTPLIRPITGGPQGQFLRQTMNMPFSRPAIMPSPARGGPSGAPPPRQLPPPPQQQFMPQGPPRPAPMYMMPQPPGNPTLHNRSTGWLDKLVDYVVGDGPANRYALICRYCATHNGLAIQEDFPFIGYRCVFCRQYNPPRQVKPAAEKLPMNTVVIEEMMEGVVTSPATSAASSISPQREVDEPLSDEGSSGTEESGTLQPPEDTRADAEETVSDRSTGSVNPGAEDFENEIQADTTEAGVTCSEGGVSQESSTQEGQYPGLEGKGPSSAESVSSTENEPFEFLESDIGPSSEVKGRGTPSPQVVEFLTEAATDLSAPNNL